MENDNNAAPDLGFGGTRSSGQPDDMGFGGLPQVYRPKTPEEAEALPPGSKFVTPDGERMVVPYRPKTPEDAEVEVPEGARFITPEGEAGTMPKYEGVGFIAQTLYDMVLTDEGREQALKTIYGDKVKKTPLGKFYVDDDGVFRRPDGRGVGGMLGHTAAEAAPLAGMTGGMYLGGAGGTLLEPGGGTAVGGFLGMTLGAMFGRQVNNIALAIAGIHEDIGEQVASMGREGMFAAGGEVVGKAVAAVPGVMKSAKGVMDATGSKVSGIVTGLSDVLDSMGITPERARYFLGTPLEEAERGARISNKGGKVAPSAIFHESPMLKKIEEFDAVFRAQNVFGKAAQDFYEQEATKIVESTDIGAKVETPLTRAEKKVSSEKAGQMAIDAARKDMAHDDAQLENSARAAKESATQRLSGEGAKAHQESLAKLNADHEAADKSARTLIDEQVKELQTNIDKALEMTKKGEDPSALLRMTAAQFKVYNAATKARAKVMYNAARGAVPEGVFPETSSLVDEAETFLDMLPESLRGKYPVEIRDLAKLAGKPAVEAAEGVKAQAAVEPTKLDWSDLHHLRSWFRHGIDYDDLTPDMREGALKSFEKKINAVLHDQEAAPELRAAAELLDRADAFYKEKVPFLNDQMVKSTMKALKSGAGINPEALADILWDPTRTEAMRRTRAIVGENLWNSVQAAHLNKMLNKSKMIDGRIDAQKFAAQVHEDVKNGLLTSAYDEATAKRVSQIAQDVAKLDGSLPIEAHEGDSMSTLIRKMRAAKEQAEKMAESDPLTALKNEVSTLDKQLAAAQKAMQQARRAAPLNFLYQNHLSHMAVKAADKILGSQDLIMAASEMFGPQSPEFNALRQVYVTRFFQRPLGKVAGMLEELGGQHGMTEEVQALMFPGVTRDQMLQVTKDMEFLFGGAGSDVGGSMAAASRVMNASQHLPIPKITGVSGLIMHLPGSEFVSRVVLGKYFAAIMDAVSHPNFMNWLAGNLKGNEQQRQVARAVVQQRLRLGGWLGAAMGQVMGAPQ